MVQPVPGNRVTPGRVFGDYGGQPVARRELDDATAMWKRRGILEGYERARAVGGRGCQREGEVARAPNLYRPDLNGQG